MQEDWKASIAKIAHWKQITSENDKLGAFPWHFPRVAASSTRISEAEGCIGAIFANHYKEFMSLADGWKGFCVSTDLFGTEDFLSGRAAGVRNRLDVQEFIAATGLPSEEVIPIGSSDVDLDVFLLMSENAMRNPGEVIWLAGSEVDRYPNFWEFFESMVNYNERLAQKLTNRQ